MRLYGISSRIPDDREGRHYLFFDIDSKDDFELMMTLRCIRNLNQDVPFYRTIVQSSPNGYHVMFFKPHSFETIAEFLESCTWVDQNWVRIGKERGYWFLVTYSPVFPPEIPVQYMKIEVPDTCEWIRKKRV